MIDPFWPTHSRCHGTDVEGCGRCSGEAPKTATAMTNDHTMVDWSVSRGRCSRERRRKVRRDANDACQRRFMSVEKHMIRDTRNASHTRDASKLTDWRGAPFHRCGRSVPLFLSLGLLFSPLSRPPPSPSLSLSLPLPSLISLFIDYANVIGRSDRDLVNDWSIIKYATHMIYVCNPRVTNCCAIVRE
jgi:hypothetical protein